MELRWVTICNKFGQRTKPELQYRESENHKWEIVYTMDFKEDEYKKEEENIDG